MNFSSKLALLTCALSLATAVAPALARTTSLGPDTDGVIAMAPECTSADRKIMSMGKSMASMPSTGDMDKDFMAMAAANAKMMAQAAKIEMACSKNPEMREAAAAVAKRNQQLLQNLGISNGSTH